MGSKKKLKLLFAHGPGNPELQLDATCFQEFEVIRAPSLSAAIRLVKTEPVHLVLVDEHLMHGKAIQLCETLYKKSSAPILLQCATPSSRITQKALGAGAQDFICRPARALELKVRAELASTARSSSERVIGIVRSLTDLSKRDSLTQLYNRGVLEDELPKIILSQQPLHLLMLDIDYFKAINDAYGHPTGDAVLIELADILEEHLRRTDMVIRYGGEEFVILLPLCSEEAALAVAEKIRRRIQNHRFRTPVGIISITVSIGIAGIHHKAPTARPQRLAKQLLAQVDRALYLAKHHGRNLIWLERKKPRHGNPA